MTNLKSSKENINDILRNLEDLKNLKSFLNSKMFIKSKKNYCWFENLLMNKIICDFGEWSFTFCWNTNEDSKWNINIQAKEKETFLYYLNVKNSNLGSYSQKEFDTQILPLFRRKGIPIDKEVYNKSLKEKK